MKKRNFYETKKQKIKAFHDYEKLPQWIQNYLGYRHYYILINDYDAPRPRWKEIKKVNGKVYGYETEEYQKWFDENQELFYTKKTVVDLINALLKNKEIED